MDMRSALQDPRNYQIFTLAFLLLWGLVALDFDIPAATAGVIVLSTLATQCACARIVGLPRFDPKSALISALSLCLLLRTNSIAIAALVAILTIASKFVLRWRGRHVFNPTNFGIAAAMVSTGSAWVSPGQWGSEAYFSFLLACLGGLVLYRAARSDVTYAFIGFYAAIVFGRALWLGDPMAIPLHQLENGAFLLFAFFMISDPKTTPDSRAGRILFALVVALGAGFVHFVLFRTNGLIWSLVVFSPTTILWNRLFPGDRYEWRKPASIPLSERSFA
ncbi:MAG TPA: RnfABCDGE type electron transport complex subunit D [Vicinamibacteria bacterium]|nr:RnfABCDGE type electron transport complex subunit D [Vicinamibacteria bacterium]